MILCLDCGNTRLKWGLLSSSGDWHHRDSLPLADIGQLKLALAGHPTHVAVIGCNVAGAATATQLETQLGMMIEWLTASATEGGVTNSYLAPGQLGADRWAALIAARHLHNGPCLVVNAGTATTIDLLSADGAFEGGVILPGIDLMRRALASNTAQLPYANAAYAELPRNTGSAIVSGTLEASVGAIERMFARLKDAAADKDEAMCILSGGSAAELQPLLTIPHRVVDDLVLHGLACLATRYRNTPSR